MYPKIPFISVVQAAQKEISKGSNVAQDVKKTVHLPELNHFFLPCAAPCRLKWFTYEWTVQRGPQAVPFCANEYSYASFFIINSLGFCSAHTRYRRTKQGTAQESRTRVLFLDLRAPLRGERGWVFIFEWILSFIFHALWGTLPIYSVHLFIFF